MGLSLSSLSLASSMEMGSRLRTTGDYATSMEDVATAVVRMISEDTFSKRDEASCVLVRCFISTRRSRLPRSLVRMVESAVDGNPDDHFLTLLATEGIESDWCDRRRSRHHQVIPLAGTTASMTFPMVTRMFRQFGCPLPVLGQQRAVFVEPAEHAFGVFHVEKAIGSSAIPDQDFVSNYRVASVVGIGGRLPTGDVFAVLVFSRDPIDRKAAALLQPWPLSITLAFLPVIERVFADESVIEQSHMSAEVRLRFEVATVRTILQLQEALVFDEQRRLAASARNDHDFGLTPRERVVLGLVATGATNKQIAANLDMSPGTVKWHIYHVFQKLGVTTRTEAVAAAREHQLLS